MKNMEDMEQFLRNFSEDELKDAVNEIKKSDLSEELRLGLIDFLETLNIEIKEAKAKGLLP
jgi:hypothetical protein